MKKFLIGGLLVLASCVSPDPLTMNKRQFILPETEPEEVATIEASLVPDEVKELLNYQEGDEIVVTTKSNINEGSPPPETVPLELEEGSSVFQQALDIGAKVASGIVQPEVAAGLLALEGIWTVISKR